MILTTLALSVLSHLAPLTPDAFYVAPPEIDLPDTSQVGGITVSQPGPYPLCIKMDPHDVYPYWEVMPPLTGVPPECWAKYQDDIAIAIARRLIGITNCLLIYPVTDVTNLCACVTDQDNRFILDCEIAWEKFLECCGIDPPVEQLTI